MTKSEEIHREQKEILPFINRCAWKEIGFPSHTNDCEKFKRNNKSIAFNILFVSHNKKEMRQAYIWKKNSDYANQVTLLMITNGKNGITLLWKAYLGYYKI